MPMYLVTVTPQAPFQRLVNAKNRAQAIGHVIDACVSAEVPTPDELFELGASGIKRERAGEAAEPSKAAVG